MSIAGKYEHFRRLAERTREEAPMPERPDKMASAILKGVTDITQTIMRSEALRVQEETSQAAKIKKADDAMNKRVDDAPRRRTGGRAGAQRSGRARRSYSRSGSSVPTGQSYAPQQDTRIQELSSENLVADLNDIRGKFDDYDSFKEFAEKSFNDLGKNQAISAQAGQSYDQMLSDAEAFYKQPAMGEEAYAQAQVTKTAQNLTNQFLEDSEYTPDQFTRYASGLEGAIGDLPGGQVAMKEEMGRALSSMSNTGTVKDILATPGLDNIYTPDEQQYIIGSTARLENLALQSDQFEADAYEANAQQAQSAGRFVPDLRTENPALAATNEILGKVGGANLMSPEQIQDTPEFQDSDTARAAATTLSFNQIRDFGSDFPAAMQKYGSATIRGPDKSTILRPLQMPSWNKEEKTVEGINVFEASLDSRLQVYSKERQARGYSSALSTPFSKSETKMLSSLAAKMDPDQRYDLAGLISNSVNDGDKSIKGIDNRASGGHIAANAIGIPHAESFLNYDSAAGSNLASRAFIAYESARDKNHNNVANLQDSYKTAVFTSEQYDMRAYGNERMFVENTMALAVGANILTDPRSLTTHKVKTSGDFLGEVGNSLNLVQPFGTRTPVMLPKELDTKAGGKGNRGAQMLTSKINGIGMAQVVHGDVYEGASKKMQNLGDFAKSHKDLIIFKNFNGRYDQVEVLVALPGPNNTLEEMQRSAALNKFTPLHDVKGKQVIISMSE